MLALRSEKAVFFGISENAALESQGWENSIVMNLDSKTWKFNSSPLKNDGWEMILSFWVLETFQGRAVKLQVGKGSVHSLKLTTNAPKNEWDEWVSSAGISKIPGGGLFSGDMLVSGRVGLMDLESTTQYLVVHHSQGSFVLKGTCFLRILRLVKGAYLKFPWDPSDKKEHTVPPLGFPI